MMTSYYREDITGLPEMGVVAKLLWRDSGLKPADIQTAFIYDHFTPFVFTQLEELGFCGRGEAKEFAKVENLSLGGLLPINTNGGLLGEAYIHGMNGITEAVRQVRGTSYNQVEHVEHVLVTSGTGVPTSGLILAPPDELVMPQSATLPQATDTRELIIGSAYVCFRRQGFQKTTIVDIARLANVSRSTIYEYFRDKAAIMEGCAERASEQFYREMSKAMDRGGSLQEKLCQAAVFVTQSRQAIASAKYFDEDAIGLLLTKDSAVLLRECIDFSPLTSPRPSSPARSVRTSTSKRPPNGSRAFCSRCSARHHRYATWMTPRPSPSSSARTWSTDSPIAVGDRPAAFRKYTDGCEYPQLEVISPVRAERSRDSPGVRPACA